MTQAIQNNLLQSAHDVSEGGLIVAITEATFGNQLGVDLTSNLSVRQFFAETQSRFVVSVSPENQVAFKQLVGAHATYLGQVTDDARLQVTAQDGAFDLSIAQALDTWKGALPCSLN